jgi:hypothetical protein
VEFREVTERAKDTIDQRTAEVIKRLRRSKRPVLAKELHEELGGAYALFIPVYSTLLNLGLVKRYRFHGRARRIRRRVSLVR